MAEEQSLNEDLESFADALRSLTPRSTQRDRLKYEIWQASTQRTLSAARLSLRLWKLATGVSTFIALSFAGLWFANLMSQSLALSQNVEAVADIPKRVDVQQIPPKLPGSDPWILTESPSGDFPESYVSQRSRALAEGIESIPGPRVTHRGDSTVLRTYQEILESVLHSQESGG